MATRSPTFASSSTHAPYFLGIELCNEQLRAAIVDEHLTTIGAEIVDFDTELPEYHTRGGLFNAPGDVYTVSIEMWLRGLGYLFEKLRAKHDLSKIKAIGGCAQLSTVWWRADSSNHLANLNPSATLHAQLKSHTFSVMHVTMPQDTTTQSQSLTLEATLGAPGANTAAHLSLPASQIFKIRESDPDAWSTTGRIMLASAFLASLFIGSWAPMSEAEVAGTGLWNHAARTWDDTALELVTGSKEEARRLRGMLGEVERSGYKPIGTVSSYFSETYGLQKDVIVVPFTSDHMATYLSLCPSPNDVIISFGSTDVLMTPAPRYLPSRLYNLHPHPAQNPNEPPRYIATLLSRNADVPRALVRDMYTKSWSAFDRLVSVIPPGGSIGLDDKVFSFWVLQGESFPFAHVKGVYRFETGIKVNEFRDLRTNPRSLMESQILSFRVRYARMIATGLIPRTQPSSRPSVLPQSLSSFGMSFDPYDTSFLPGRVIAVGSAANFPSVMNLLGDVFNAPVYVPLADSSVANAGQKAKPATSSSGTTTPGGVLSPGSSNIASVTAMTMTAAASLAAAAAHLPPGTVPAPSRASAALGGAYLARWGWRRIVRPEEKYDTFEDEIRFLLRKARSGSGNAPANPYAHSHSGVSTPMPRSGSTLASITAFNEEDEDDGDEVLLPKGEQTHGFRGSAVPITPIVQHTLTDTRNFNTPSTPSTLITSSSTSMGSINSAFGNLTLNTSAGSLSVGPYGSSATSISSGVPPPPLSAGISSHPATISVAPLQTDESDIEVNLVKVSEADLDSFMTYAALVPEYCRLEGMLVRALV